MERREAQGRLEARHRGPAGGRSNRNMNTSRQLQALVAGTTMGVMEPRLEIGRIRTLPLGSFGVKPIGTTDVNPWKVALA